MNAPLWPLDSSREARGDFEGRRLISSDVGGKVVVSMLALGAFRIGTLCKLRYRHVRHDLERNATPVHIHVEAEVTKGGYHDYDTFIGYEAAQFLSAYLEARKKGGLTNKIPPENLTDDSPLLRDEHCKVMQRLQQHPTRRWTLFRQLVFPVWRDVKEIDGCEDKG